MGASDKSRRGLTKHVLDTLTQSEPQTVKETVAQAVPQTVSQTFPHTSVQVHTDTDDPAAPLRDRLTKGKGKQRLEDTRKRQTFWLDSEEINMVAELSEATGVGKYEIVGTAIRLLYKNVLER